MLRDVDNGSRWRSMCHLIHEVLCKIMGWMISSVEKSSVSFFPRNLSNIGLKYSGSGSNHWWVYSGHSPLCLGFH